MAIGAKVSPEVIVFGVVTDVRRKDWEGKYTGERVTIDTNGGPLIVSFRVAAAEAGLVPQVGQVVALVASVYDGQNGASLTFEHGLTHGDLDAILTQALGAPVGAK